jgi:hypothetical protein
MSSNIVLIEKNRPNLYSLNNIARLLIAKNVSGIENCKSLNGASGNTLYLYEDPHCHDGYRSADNYMWRSKATDEREVIMKLKGIKSILRDKGKNGFSRVTVCTTRFYGVFNGQRTTKFRKVAYSLASGNKVIGTHTTNRTLVHYIGDESQCDNRMRPIVKHSLRLAKAKLSKGSFQTTAGTLYLEQLADAEEKLDPSSRPRNAKQCENLIFRERSGRRLIPRDSIISAFVLGELKPDVYVQLVLRPELEQIVICPAALDLVKLWVARPSDFGTVQLGIDTTYDVCQAHLTIISVRNPMCVGCPVMIIAILFHDARSEFIHESFLRYVLVDKLQLKSENFAVSLDREQAITNAFKNLFVNCQFMYCAFHLWRNIRSWLADHGARAFDHKTYSDCFFLLARCTNIEEYETLYAQLSAQWDSTFAHFFVAHIEPSLKINIGCEAHRLCNQVSDGQMLVTNNASESLNAKLKRLMAGQLVRGQTRFDDALIVVNLLQEMDMYELSRAVYEGEGNLKLRDDIRNNSELLATIQKNFRRIPHAARPFEEQLSAVKTEYNLSEDLRKSMTCETMTAGSLHRFSSALLADSELHQIGVGKYIIANTQDSRGCLRVPIYVRLGSELPRSSNQSPTFSRAECSCLLRRGCVHIFAVIQSLGLSEMEAFEAKHRPSLSLSRLHLASLRRKGRCTPGRKGAPSKRELGSRKIDLITAHAPKRMKVGSGPCLD